MHGRHVTRLGRRQALVRQRLAVSYLYLLCTYIHKESSPVASRSSKPRRSKTELMDPNPKFARVTLGPTKVRSNRLCSLKPSASDGIVFYVLIR
jgi:hypothetical protein